MDLLFPSISLTEDSEDASWKECETNHPPPKHEGGEHKIH